MSSNKGAVRRESSRSRSGAATLDADARVHRSKRESSRDLDAAHVIDVSVPRVKAGRSDATSRPRDAVERVKAGRSEATSRPRDAVERVRTAKTLDEEDVKRHVRKMRESASKVREAVKDGRTKLTSRSEAGVVGDKVPESKKPSSVTKTPTKSTESKPHARALPQKSVETPQHRARETASRKPVETSRSKSKADAGRSESKPSEQASRSQRTDVRALRGVEEKHKEVERAARHKRHAEERVKEITGRTHKKSDDKTNSKSRRGDGEAAEKVTERRKTSKEEKERKLREDGDKGHREITKGDHKREKTSNTGGEVRVDEKPRERNRTRVLSPSEVRVARDVAAMVATEGGATPDGRRRGSDGRRVADDRRSAVASTSKEPDYVASLSGGDDEVDAEEDYEDDFEDYESDFEEDSSEGKEDSVVPELTTRQQPAVDEEKKLDSGNYDLAENQKRSKYLHEIKVAMDRENLALNERRRDVHAKETSSLVDEGFEEEKSEDTARGSAPGANNFINFASARKRQKEQKLTAHSRRRGDALLSMITLDVVKYRLFEMPPVPYDAFMSRYGRAGTAQAHVQTNEDRLDEEVQTDEIRTRDCWTQRPASCGGAVDGVVKTTREQELLGMGVVLPEDENVVDKRKPSKPSRTVEQFLNSASPLMLSALREGRSHRALQQNIADVGFSKGFVSLGVETLPFLANRAVTLVRYPPGQPSKLLTVHAAKQETSDTDADADASLRRCIVCVWNVLTPDAPLHTLASWRDVTASCFESERATLVLAGLDDGAVVVWDLRDAATHHGDVEKWRLRSPTYSTAEVLRDDGHLGRVVALQPLIDKDAEGIDDFSPTQVCSLEESGVAIVWTVIHAAVPGVKSGASQHDLGLAYWGRVRLVKTSTLSLEDLLPEEQLFPSLLFSDMQVNGLDCHHLFASADTGEVVHALTSGAKPTPRVYHPKTDGLTFAQCIETFPFGNSLFLVGCGDGSVRLHRRESDNPLTVLAGTGEAPGQGPVIRCIQWSRSRPTVFFVLDDQSRVHVWDLGLSDMYPRLTATPSSAGVSAIQVAPDLQDGKTRPQMVIASNDGVVQVHELKDEYRFRSAGDMNKELNNFIRFTNIL